MNPTGEKKLMSFYFGSVTEDERFRCEQDLLTDTETLLDYLDLKRSIESAELVPSQPSRNLWMRLQPKLKNRRRLILSVGLGIAVAASVIFLSFHFLNAPMNQDTPTSTSGILFDATFEQPAGSNVL